MRENAGFFSSLLDYPIQCADDLCIEETCQAFYSTAEDVSTSFGAAGAVGRLLFDLGGTVYYDASGEHTYRTGTKDRCSGTLIARNEFLTAAHCLLDDKKEAKISQQALLQNINRLWVQFPQAPGRRFYASSIQVLEPAWAGAGFVNGRDVALVTLGEDVPTDIVHHTLPVFTGSLDDTLFIDVEGSGHAAQAAFVDPLAVGFGVGNGIPVGGTPFRAYGPIPSVSKQVSCDRAPCIGYAEGTSEPTSTTHGDSGGPLLMRERATGRYMVVGVVSGGPPGYVGTGSFAPTGNLAGTGKNGDWLADLLDEDGDGVQDTLDNCPAWRCANPYACANPNQTDSDGDGVGDVCDNCNPAAIAVLAARHPGATAFFSAYNRGQENSDHDILGDVCDLCPLLTDRIPVDSLEQPDADGDFIGDSCDLCQDSYDAQAYCQLDADCGGGRLRCAAGRCQSGANSDGDDVPDACDLCPTKPNGLLGNISSNFFGEREAGVDVMGDACDAAPIAVLDEQSRAIVLKGDPTPLQQVTVSGRSWVGPNKLTRTVSPFDIRHCDCYNSLNQALPREKCIREQCQMARFDELGLRPWRTITLWRNGQSQTQPVGPISFEPKTFKEDFEFRWAWKADAMTGIIPSRNTADGRPSTYGVLASRVVEPLSGDSRDRELLRTNVQLFRTPFFSERDASLGYQFQCGAPRCVLWLRRLADERINPSPFETLMDRRLPTAVVAFDNKAALLLNRNDPLIASADLSQQLLAALSTSDRYWLTPSEFGLQLAGRKNVHSAVALARGASSMRPARVTLDGDLAEAEIAEPDDAVVVPTGGVAIYSAIEDAAYVIGGAIAGRPTGTIRQYSFATGKTSVVAGFGSTVAPSENVLAATFDSVARRLYVLEASISDNEARLVRYDLVDRTGLVVWRLPYHQVYDRVDLALTLAGELVLSAQRLDDITIWKIKAFDKSISFDGVAELAGQLLDGAVPGESELYLPVLRSGRLSLESIDRLDFSRGGECTGL